MKVHIFRQKHTRTAVYKKTKLLLCSSDNLQQLENNTPINKSWMPLTNAMIDFVSVYGHSEYSLRSTKHLRG